ncbi:MAG: glycogen debranching protein GlgX, partial [Steroidobacteraceae bacterium]
VWFDPAGTEMSDQQWQESFARSLGVFLSGRGLDEHGERGQPIVDTDFLLLFNAHHEALEFRLPREPGDARWVLRLDTANAHFEKEEREWRPGDAYTLQGRALALFEFPQHVQRP